MKVFDNIKSYIRSLVNYRKACKLIDALDRCGIHDGYNIDEVDGKIVMHVIDKDILEGKRA